MFVTGDSSHSARGVDRTVCTKHDIIALRLDRRSNMFDQRIFRKVTFALFSGLLLFFTAGCGGGSSTTQSPLPVSKTATQLKIGDAAADRVISFEVSVANPIVLTMSSGADVKVNLGSNRLELSHMSAKVEPLTITSVPQGTYTSALLTISNPEVIFLDNNGVAHSIESNASQKITVTLNPALTVGATPAIVSIDVDAANSVSTDASGNITGFNFSPGSFGITTKSIAAQKQEDDDGELEDVTGLVASVSGNSFVLNVGQSGAQLTFATDNTTQFGDGLTDVTSTLNQIVKVEGKTKADGTLFAAEVEGLENQNGADLEGIVRAVTGNPATALSLTAQEGTGNGMDATKVGSAFSVNVSGAQYKVNAGNIDTSGLGGIPGTPNFPFDASTIMAGQRVEVETATAVPATGGNILADKVKLQQQTLKGTVSNFAAGAGGAASFDLNLPADSYLTLLSGNSVVHVLQQPGTDNRSGAIANNNSLRVRGLLFWTGTSFNMIARRITP